ncbi:MAG: gamma-glutamyltransferase family protein [Myxococcota bacterium]
MDWSFAFPSQRMPVLAENVVATSQPLAAQAGLMALRDGGSAVDAALAAAITLTVVEPTANGIGGDLFALVWQDGALHGLNATGRSPQSLDAAAILRAGQMPQVGWWPVTVPGAPSGWKALSDRFGRIDFPRLFTEAIRYARQGFAVSPQTAHAWAISAKRFQGFAAFAQTFMPRGRAPRVGERFACPAQAATLEQIAATGADAFYTGPLADAMVSTAMAEGGALRHADLAEHAVKIIEPLSVAYRKRWRLHELPPNGQGIAALIALGILDRLPPGTHAQIEAMKLGFADAHRYVADPDHLDMDPTMLLSPAYLDERAAMVRPDMAQDYGHGQPRPGGTVLVTAADSNGQMVTLIQSNYMGFGSGVVIPGTGIAMQNRGCGFSLEDGHPNRVGGGKRPYHTIIPGFLTCDGAPIAAFGVMGGLMQPQGHLQVACRMIDEDHNPQSALDAPRWRVSKGLNVRVEPGWPDDVLDDLRGKGHQITVTAKQTVHFGGGQAIWRMPSGCYIGASDLRRDGQAVGF